MSNYFNLEDLKRIDDGDDTIVYLDKENNHIVKDYSIFMRNNLLNTKNCLKIIQRYNEDTLKSAEIINSSNYKNNLPTLTLNKQNYKTNIKIIPQGEANIEGKGVVSRGQKFIIGQTLLDFQDDYEYYPLFKERNEENINIETDLTQSSELDKLIDQTTNTIYQHTKIRFDISPINIKIGVDKEKKYFNFIITDLAGGIKLAYRGFFPCLSP